jgi:tetratricopeptide (TPR) repeat protein
MRLLAIALLTSLLFLACDKGQEKPAAPDSAEMSLFEEVRARTVNNPRDPEAWYHLADLYERSEMYREEVDALNKVIALEPERGFTYMRLGAAYSRLGRHQDAVKNYVIAKKYLPGNAVLHNNLAVAYGKLGKTDEEIASLQRAISLRPNYATARYNLGMVYLKWGKREPALKQYYELRKFDEGMARALKKEIDAKGK